MKKMKKLSAMLLILAMLAACMAVPVAADETVTEPSWALTMDFDDQAETPTVTPLYFDSTGATASDAKVAYMTNSMTTELTTVGSDYDGVPTEGDYAYGWQAIEVIDAESSTTDDQSANKNNARGLKFNQGLSSIAGATTIVLGYDFMLEDVENVITGLGILMGDARAHRLGLYVIDGELRTAASTAITTESGTKRGTITANEWHRLGLVWKVTSSGKTLDVYLDGEALALGTSSTNTQAPYGITIATTAETEDYKNKKIFIDDLYLGTDIDRVAPEDPDGTDGIWSFNARRNPPADTAYYNDKDDSSIKGYVSSAGKSVAAGDYAFRWTADKSAYESDNGYLCRNNGYGLIFGAGNTEVVLNEDDEKPWGFQYDFKLHKTEGVAANLASVRRNARYMSLGLYVINGKLYYAKNPANSTAKDAVAIVGAPEITADKWYTLSVVYHITAAGKTADIYLDGVPICIGLSTTNADDPTGVAMALASTTGDNTDMHMYIDNLYLGQDLTKLDIEAGESGMVLDDITDGTNSVQSGISAAATQLNLLFTTHESGLSGAVIVAQKDASGKLLDAALQNVKFDSLATAEDATVQYQKVLPFENLTIDEDAAAIEVLIWKDLTDLQPWFDGEKITIPVNAD